MRTDPGIHFSSDYQPRGLNLPGRHFQDGVSQSGHERNHLFLSSGGAFDDVSGVSGCDSVADGRAFALVDYDRDGWQDLAVVNANAPKLELFHNRMARLSEASPGFVAVRLVGGNRGPRPSPLSNRDAYGAIVEVDLGDVTLLREHRAGEGLAAQNGSTMLIGIGDAQRVQELRIRWPSGTESSLQGVDRGVLVTAFEDPGADQRFEIAPYPPAGGRVGPTSSAVASALKRAEQYFAEHVRSADPSWVSLFGYMRRHFDFEVMLASGQKAHTVSGGTSRPEVFEVFRRIDDPSAAIEKQKIADLPHVIDRITASALHCDRIDLPADWLEILGKASRVGNYALTHATLATQWSVENGCISREASAGLRGEQVRMLTELVDDRAALAGVVDSDVDLWIEAMVMLYYVGAADAVEPGWVASLVAAQRADGGWPRSTGSSRSDPHPSALALWVLLEQTGDPAPGPWLLPGGSRPSAQIPGER